MCVMPFRAAFITFSRKLVRYHLKLVSNCKRCPITPCETVRKLGKIRAEVHSLTDYASVPGPKLQSANVLQVTVWQECAGINKKKSAIIIISIRNNKGMKNKKY